MITRFLDWLMDRPYEVQSIICAGIGGMICFLMVLAAILIWNVTT